MIQFKPKTLFRFSLIVVSTIILLLIIFFFYIVQNQFINYWQKSIRVFVSEKNQNFNHVFFKNQIHTTNNPFINFDYFTNLLSQDISLKEHNFVDLFVINMKKEIIYRFNDNTPQFSRMYYTPDQILYLISKDVNSIQIKSFTLEHDGNYYLIVISPLITNQGYRLNTLVYVFDYSFIMKRVFPFFMPILLFLIIFCLFIGSSILFRNYVIQYLDHISKYVSYHIFRDQVKPEPLKFSYPFNVLENKISFLVAQRKEIEDKFFDLNQKFNLLINQTNDGILLEDVEGYIYYCNKKVNGIFGLENEMDMLGRKFKDFLSDNESLRKFETEYQYRQNKTSNTYRLNFINKKGVKKQIMVSTSANFNNYQQIIGYYSSITDLSDIENMSNEKQSLQKLRSTLMDLSLVPTVLYDQEMKVIDLNQEMINLIEKPKKDLVGYSLKNTIGELDFNKIINQSDLNSEFQIEAFEPKFNKWFYVINAINQIEEDLYHQLLFIDITQFRKEETFHQTILNEIKGFFFITNLQNKVIYVSPSFHRITGNPIEWFHNYYQSIFQVVERKNQDFFESFIISHGKNRYEFSVHKISTNTNSSNLFVCILK